MSMRQFSSDDTKPKRWTPEDPEPDVPEEEFKKMQASLTRFSQCMSLGKYQAA